MSTRQEAVTVLRLDTAQHDAAAAKAATAIGQVGKAGEMSARQTAAAMRSLPAQFTDVATQLAGGQNPLLILLQQGGQVRDQFGSIGAALRGIGSLITPATLGIGVLAALGGVLLAVERDAARLRDTLALTNNAAGLTPGSLAATAAQVAANSQASVRSARQIVLELASTGQISGRVMDEVALAVARVAEVSGRSSADVAKDFARMGSGVAAWAAEHNRQYNFLTADIYRQIAALEEQGRAEEAMALVSRRLTQQLEDQREQLGWAERAWNALGKAAADAWDSILAIGRPDTLQQQLDSVMLQIEANARRTDRADSYNAVTGRRTEGADTQLARLREQARRLIEQRDRELIGAQEQSDAAARNREEVRAEQERQRELKARRDAAARAAAAARERAFDRTPPLAGLDYRDRSDRLVPPAVPDPLGEFIGERVLPAARERDERRLQQQQDFLQQLVDATASANLALITDDRQRALAQIALEREQLQRRIELTLEAGPARAEAERQADEAAAARVAASGLKLAKETALVTREETRDALAAAFRDTKNPLKAFGDALGNIVFQRVSTALADALVNAALGPGTGGGGGLLGSAFSFLGGLFSGGLAVGGGVRAGRLYEVNEGDSGPGEMLRTASGRQYLMAAEDGEVVPYRRSRAAAAPAAGVAPGHTVVIHQTNHFGGGISRAELAAQAEIERRATQALVLRTLQRERAL